MALRNFEDESGTAWLAWDVPPPRFFQPVRSTEDRRSADDPGCSLERRSGQERRQRSLTPGLERGWVCFQSGEVKRRIAPPPAGWDTCAEEELRRLLQRSSALEGHPERRS